MLLELLLDGFNDGFLLCHSVSYRSKKRALAGLPILHRHLQTYNNSKRGGSSLNKPWPSLASPAVLCFDRYSTFKEVVAQSLLAKTSFTAQTASRSSLGYDITPQRPLFMYHARGKLEHYLCAKGSDNRSEVSLVFRGQFNKRTPLVPYPVLCVGKWVLDKK